MSGLYLSFQGEHRDLGPDPQAAGKGQEAKTAVDIEVSVLFVREAGPVEIPVLNGAPSETIGFDAHLGAVGMTGQGQMDGRQMIPDLVFPMGGIMRQTYFEGVFVDALQGLVKITDLDESATPVLNTDQGDMLTIFFEYRIFVEHQPVAQLLVMTLQPFEVGRFFLLTGPFDIITIVVVTQNRELSKRRL